MQAAHSVSWEPPSAQDMRLEWRPHSMRSQQKEITALFRKSSYVRMLISSSTRQLDRKRTDRTSQELEGVRHALTARSGPR